VHRGISNVRPRLQKSGIHYQLITGCSLVVLWFKPKNNQRTAIEHHENKRITEFLN
jgi:hypothetical protein